MSSIGSSKAVPWIRANLSRLSGRSLVESASLLWKVEKDPAAVNMFTKRLESNEFWSSRIDAAFAVRVVRTAESVAALETALNDPEYLVRHHAAKALLDIYDINSDREELSQNVMASHSLSIAIMSDDRTRRQEAVTALKKLIQSKGKIEFEA